MRTRQGRRLWGRWVRKAKGILQALPPAPTGAFAGAANLLRRVLEERGRDGLATPPDRVTHALDADARFGCKGEGSHRVTWQGYKVTLVTQTTTDLILTAHVMSANHVDGDALVPAVDALQPIFGRPVQLDADGATTDRARRESMADRDVLLIGPRRTARKPGRVPGGGRVASRGDRGRRSGGREGPCAPRALAWQPPLSVPGAAQGLVANHLRRLRGQLDASADLLA